MKNHSFTIIFILVILAMAGGLLYYFTKDKKNDTTTRNINTENVELINKDDGSIISNMKASVDDDDDKVEVKKEINIDMSKLFSKKEETPTTTPATPTTFKASQSQSGGSSFHSKKAKTEPKEIIKEEPAKVVIAPVKRSRTGFNDSQQEEKSTTDNNKNKSAFIKVVVHNQCSVKTGSSVRMRATEDFTIDGVTIPKNTFISGVVSINSQRVNIKIPSIEYKNQIFAVNYSAFDGGDGLEGVSVPDLILHDATKEELNGAVKDVKISTPYVTIPVGTSRKKIEEASATLTENYKILLRLSK